MEPDIVNRASTDGGATWSAPQIIAPSLSGPSPSSPPGVGRHTHSAPSDADLRTGIR